MNTELNQGPGLCQATHRVLIAPVRAVIELGASGDVRQQTLNAVHHANRHGPVDDYIAVALPQMRPGRYVMQPGHEIELIASEAALTAFLALDGPARLRRRGMIEAVEVDPSYMEPGMSGAAYVRDRAAEKYTDGWVRRSRARAQRRGKPVAPPARVRDPDPRALALYYGQAVVHVRQMIATVTDEPLRVSTYGFSRATAPAVLPVWPDAMDADGDAA